MNSKRSLVSRVVSGGQTGVDRAALDAAIALGIDHGGWCPAGRLAEDGPIPSRYQLRETEAAEYTVRTEWNVRDSDATLIICRGEPRGGTLLTSQLAGQYGRPCLIVDLNGDVELERIRQWLRSGAIAILNIAGPRESQSPGIAQASRELLTGLLGPQ